MHQEVIAGLTQTSQTVAGLIPNVRLHPERSRPCYQLSCQVHVKLLPEIRHDLTALSLALQPTDLLKADFDRSKAYAGFLEVLKQFQARLQTLSAFIQTAENPPLKQHLVIEEHIGRTKFRELCWSTADLLRAVQELMDLYATYFAASTRSEIEYARQGVLQLTSRAWKAIDEAGESQKLPDLVIVQRKAEGMVEFLEDAMEEVRNLLERPGADDLQQAIGALSVNDDVLDDDHEDVLVKLNEHERTRVNLTIPIIRLCRVMLTKLIKTTDDRQTLFKQMSTSQLEGTLEYMGHFPDRIDDIVCELDSSPQSSMHILKALHDLYEDCGQLMRIAFSDIPDDGVNNKSIDPEQEWFQVWFKQVQKAYQTLVNEFV
ncbi:hypothetical protein CROQUDRAFT_89378 [Cronartium quercuum f. sp. fusiforme G11]|uniref:Uncharacterized protein n=1 Tax=Cronartium quercuum f. sp. fusiforme G11 TaxID=708437 RepID=A0A9P6NLJ4_9BASI|nr:hypothetical protein CROQUDRAFT_89378 [Cronartium quercuum f. sp. fusiforme G11]